MTKLHSGAWCVLVFALVIVGLRAAGSDDVSMLKSTGSCPNCKLNNADLSGVSAENGDLSYADLRGAQLYMATLSGANLTGALLENTNLSGAILRDAKGADLTTAITDVKTICPNGAQGPCQ